MIAKRQASEARRAALRQLFEKAPASLDRLAAAGGLKPSTLARLAAREGWQAPEGLRARLERIIDRKLRQVEEMDAAGGGADKESIQAISVLSRMLEKYEGTPGPAEANENPIERDRETAAALAIINERIVELARELAGRIVAGDVVLPADAGRGEGMVDAGAAQPAAGAPPA